MPDFLNFARKAVVSETTHLKVAAVGSHMKGSPRWFGGRLRSMLGVPFIEFSDSAVRIAFWGLWSKPLGVNHVDKKTISYCGKSGKAGRSSRSNTVARSRDAINDVRSL